MQPVIERFALRRLQVWLTVVIAVALTALLPVIAEPVLAAEIAGSGDYKAGEALFTGRTRFENGGPPCISCHSTGVGALGGGTLGPNLTKVWAEKFFLIDAGWINSEGVPVMGAIFPKRNITEEEVEHLKAFFSVRAQEAPKSSTGKFVGISIAGFIGLIIIMGIIWSGRYRSRNQGTAHDALWRNYGGKGGR